MKCTDFQLKRPSPGCRARRGDAGIPHFGPLDGIFGTTLATLAGRKNAPRLDNRAPGGIEAVRVGLRLNVNISKSSTNP